MGKISGAPLLVRAMRRHGVERIFGLCGDHVNSIFNACLDEGVGVVDTRHESGATHLADGWARVTGRPGGSVVTGGPGHPNSLTGRAPPAPPLGLLPAPDRPEVVAGSGVWWSRGWGALERFVEAAQLPCFTIGMARGAVSDEHPLCLGYADPILNAAAREIKRADVVLLIGKRVDFRLAYGNLFGPDAALIQIDVHGPELGRNRAAQLPIQADARVALEQLAAAAERHGGWRQKERVEELRRDRRALRAAGARPGAGARRAPAGGGRGGAGGAGGGGGGGGGRAPPAPPPRVRRGERQ